MMSVEIVSRPDLKRDRDSFEELADLEEPCSVPANFLENMEAEEQEKEQLVDSTCDPPQKIENKSTTQDPITSSIPSSTTSTNPISLSSSATPAPSTTTPPAKKTKLTSQEMKRINKEIKDREKAEEKARKEAEKEAERKKKEIEKAEKEAEKEAERKKKEMEKAEKEAEKQRKEAEREEKRRRVEEDRQRKEDEKKKKASSQLKLNSFFTLPPPNKQRAGSADSRGRASMSPAPPSSHASVTSPATGTPRKSQHSDYEMIFPPFHLYVKEGVTVAPNNRFERDEPATESIEQQLDSYISGTQTRAAEGSFDAISLFNMSSYDSAPRGKRYLPVREIMEELYSGKTSGPIDLTTDSQNSQIKKTRYSLQKIPLKFLKFQEDVRPPYRGTYTNRPVNGIAKLARQPFRRDLPKTDYDYDSEAEWIEDEDGEDLKSGDEEEEIEDDEDMDGFLDDEGDETASSRRMVLQGDLEPISTGLCWEDRKKRNTDVKMLRYRMEVILDPKLKSIDPFSSEYWSAPTTSMEPPRVPLNTVKSTSLNFNSFPSTASNTKSIKPFFTTGSDPTVSTSAQPSPPGQSISSTKSSIKDDKLRKMLPAEDMEAFKAAVVGSDLSKLGLIEVLKKKFHGRSAAMIKSTLETYAKRGRAGEKEKEKRWMLVDSSGM